ncbi:hypothetical protein H1R20_g3134, partial [Candolleomyces eurysporus]
MVDKVGLIYKGNQRQIPFAYELYEKSESEPQEDKLEVGTGAKTSDAGRFKDAFCRNVKIHFVGACTKVNRSTPPFRWMALEAMAVGLRIKELQRQPKPNERIEIKESLTKLWYLFELYPFRRLSFNSWGTQETTRAPHLWAGRQIQEGQKIHCSLLLGSRTDHGGTITYTPKARPPEVRSPEPEQPLDSGEREGEREWSFDWASLHTDLDEKRWLAVDVDYVRTRVKHAAEPHDVIESLKGLGDNDGIVESKRAKAQTIYDQIIYSLEREEFKADLGAKHLLVQGGMDLLSGADFSYLKVVKLPRLRGILFDLLGNESSSGLAQQFLAKLTDPFHRITLTGRSWHQVRSIAVSPNGRIVAGFSDDKIRVWDASEGVEKLAGERPLHTWDAAAKEHWYSRRREEHKETVISVAISLDCTHVVSASRDKTIRIWDMETGRRLKLIREPGVALSVAISHNSKYVVAGCEDKGVRIWDAATGQLWKELRGHRDRVRSVVISKGNKYIVSGSNDRSVRIWELGTGELMQEIKTTHRTAVRSVAVTLTDDSKLIRVVSGSTDRTIEVWEVERKTKDTRKICTAKGHTDRLLCVAISPDGKYIVSSSDDLSIRVWNLNTGEQVGEPLGRHTKPVRSVAILSMPGTGPKIVSGCDDNKIRVWDMGEVFFYVSNSSLESFT